MRASRYCLVLMLAGCALAPSSPGAVQSVATKTPLCRALGEIRDGERRVIEISGIYSVSYELQVLYDPDEPACSGEFQPSTWVEFSRSVPRSALEDLERILKASSGRAFVTFRGELNGPVPLGVDDLSLPLTVSYAKRVATSRYYGHLNSFRTKVVVDEIKSAESVPPTVPRALVWNQKPPNLNVQVMHAELVTYPPFAYAWGITGSVTVTVTVKDGQPIATDPKSGDRLLAQGACENIKTWRFNPGTNAVFETTFIYDLERRQASDQVPRIELRLPYQVRIVAAREEW